MSMSFTCPQVTPDEAAKKITDSLNANTAGIFSGTGIPLLDSVLSNLSQTITKLSTGIKNDAAAIARDYSTASAYVQQQLSKTGFDQNISTVVSSFSSIVNISTDAFLNAGYALLTDTLKRQVCWRNILLQEINFHIIGVLDILKQLNTPAVLTLHPNPILARAYPFILESYRDLSKINNSLHSQNPRFSKALFNLVINAIDVALSILTDKTTGSVISQLSNVRNGQPSIVKQTTYQLEGVAATIDMLAETYMWHLENLISLASGNTPVGLTATSLISNNTATEPNALLAQRQTQLNTLKTTLFKNPIISTNTVLGALAWMANNPDLTNTHAQAIITAEYFKTAPTDLAGLVAASSTLWSMMSPSLAILQDTTNKTQQALSGSFNSGTLMAINLFSPLSMNTWVTSELIAAKALLNNPGISSLGAVVENMDILNDIIEYLNSPRYATGIAADNEVLNLITTAATFTQIATLKKGILKRALVIFNEIHVLCNTGIQNDTDLLNLLEQFDMINNPAVTAIVAALGGLAAQCAMGAMIAYNFSSGAFKTITSLLGSVQTAARQAVATVTNAFNALTGSCKLINNNASVNNQKATIEDTSYNSILTETTQTTANRTTEGFTTIPLYSTQTDANIA